jgi:hypothetical protein
MTSGPSQPWIGLVEVEPWPGNTIFDLDPGAFSNVLCLAADETGYREKVAHELGKLGLKVVSCEGVEPLAERRLNGFPDEVSDEILKLSLDLSETSPVLYDTFYVYKSVEE